MNVVVTGGAGFIGSHLVERLISDGADVTVVDNFDSFYAEAVKRSNLVHALRHPRARLVELDIRDAEGVDRLIQAVRPDIIMHLAARAGVRPSIENPALYRCQCRGDRQSARECQSDRAAAPVCLCLESSVYGDRPDAPFRETDSVDLPVSPYAATKKACELLAHTFHHIHGLPVTGLRFFTAYGPRNRPDLAIAKFARLIEAGEPVPMFGDGTTRRDYTYVEDIVDGVVRAVDRCTGYHIYNLGNSSPIQLSDLIDAIGEALGKRPIIKPPARTARRCPSDFR